MAMEDDAIARLDEWDQASVLVVRASGESSRHVASHAFLLPGDALRLVWVGPHEPGDPHDSPLGHQVGVRVLKLTDDAMVLGSDEIDAQIMLTRADPAHSEALRAWLRRRTPAEVRADRERTRRELQTPW